MPAVAVDDDDKDVPVDVVPYIVTTVCIGREEDYDVDVDVVDDITDDQKSVAVEEVVIDDDDDNEVLCDSLIAM